MPLDVKRWFRLRVLKWWLAGMLACYLIALAVAYIILIRAEARLDETVASVVPETTESPEQITERTAENQRQLDQLDALFEEHLGNDESYKTLFRETGHAEHVLEQYRLVPCDLWTEKEKEDVRQILDDHEAMYEKSWEIAARLVAGTKTTYQPQEYDVTSTFWRPSYAPLQVHALSAAMDGRFDESMHSLNALMDLGDFRFYSRNLYSNMLGIWIYSRAQCVFFQIYEHGELPRDLEDAFVTRLAEGKNKQIFLESLVLNARPQFDFVLKVMPTTRPLLGLNVSLDPGERMERVATRTGLKLYQSPIGLPYRMFDKACCYDYASNLIERLVRAEEHGVSPWRPGGVDYWGVGLRGHTRFLSEDALESLARHLFYQAEHECWIDLTVIGMRIERYLRDHGSLPGSLADVIEDGEEDLILDPFSGEPFIYLPKKGTSYSLYGVGPNWVDDGGAQHSRYTGDVVWYPKVAYQSQFWISPITPPVDASPPDPEPQADRDFE